MLDVCIQVDTGARQKIGVFSREFGLTGLLRVLGVALTGCMLLGGIVHAQAPQPRSGAAAGAPTLDQLGNSDRSMRIFLRADDMVPSRDLMDAMNALRTAGYLKVALVGLETDVPR